MVLGIALLTALAILGGCGSSMDSSTANRQTGWVGAASHLCRQALFHREQMPAVHISSYDQVVPKMARNERALAKKLEGLKASRQEVKSIARLVALLVRQSHQADAAVRTFGAHPLGPHGRVPQYEAHVRSAQSLDDKIAAVARVLGVRSCAHTPLRSSAL